MRGVKLNTVQCTKDLGVKIASNLKFSQQCVDAANKANRILGFIKINFSFKNKDAVLPLYNSLVRPHLEYAVQFWSPHHVKDIAKLEGVQRRATKSIPSLRNKAYIVYCCCIPYLPCVQYFSCIITIILIIKFYAVYQCL